MYQVTVQTIALLAATANEALRPTRRLIIELSNIYQKYWSFDHADTVAALNANVSRAREIDINHHTLAVALNSSADFSTSPDIPTLIPERIPTTLPSWIRFNSDANQYELT